MSYLLTEQLKLKADTTTLDSFVKQIIDYSLANLKQELEQRLKKQLMEAIPPKCSFNQALFDAQTLKVTQIAAQIYTLQSSLMTNSNPTSQPDP